MNDSARAWGRYKYPATPTQHQIWATLRESLRIVGSVTDSRLTPRFNSPEA